MGQQTGMERRAKLELSNKSAESTTSNEKLRSYGASADAAAAAGQRGAIGRQAGLA